MLSTRLEVWVTMPSTRLEAWVTISAPGLKCQSPSQPQDYRHEPPLQHLYMGTRDKNLAPHSCRASILCIMLSFQLLQVNLFIPTITIILAFCYNSAIDITFFLNDSSFSWTFFAYRHLNSDYYLADRKHWCQLHCDPLHWPSCQRASKGISRNRAPVL